jgi:hypothetical protein
MKPGQSVTINADFLADCKIHVSNYSGLDWCGTLDIKRLLMSASAVAAAAVGQAESERIRRTRSISTFICM